MREPPKNTVGGGLERKRVVLNYRHVPPCTGLYRLFLTGNVTNRIEGCLATDETRTKHRFGRDIEQDGAEENRGWPQKNTENAKRGRKWSGAEMEYGSRGVVGCRPVWVEAGRRWAGSGKRWAKRVGQSAFSRLGRCSKPPFPAKSHLGRCKWLSQAGLGTKMQRPREPRGHRDTEPRRRAGGPVQRVQRGR